MKRTFFIFSVITMVVMAMSFVGCDKDETIEPSQTTEDSGTHLKSLPIAPYNGYSASSYALSWTDNSGALNSYSSYNTSTYMYWVVGSSSDPNDPYNTADNSDCANFVSQSLLAGLDDSEMDATWYHNGTYWPSDAWIKVTDLYNWIKGKYQTAEIVVNGPQDLDYSYYLDDAEVGDVVFSLSSDGMDSHVMIVTGFYYSGGHLTGILVSGHTRNYLNKSFNDILSTNDIYRIIKL